MKTLNKKMTKSIFIFLICVFTLPTLYGQHQTSVIKKSFHFTIPSHGTKTFKINVPENTKKIRAVISNHTQMVNMDIDGPTHAHFCHNSTWSDSKHWKKPLHCSASVGKTKLDSPGTWFIKVEGSGSGDAFHEDKKTTGLLTVFIDVEGNLPVETTNTAVVASHLPWEKKIHFKILSHGTKIYSIHVPEGAKKISAVISNHTQMIAVEIDGPTKVSFCHNSTWSHSNSWKQPQRCSASVGKTKLDSPGTWYIKVEGQGSEDSFHENKWTTGTLTIHIQ